MFKEHFPAMQYAPFRLAKWPISEAEKHHIAPWNGLFRITKWAISERRMYLFGLWYGVYQKAIQPEIGLTMPYLTFLYISFGKIFCQNLIKKISKYAVWVFFWKADIIREQRRRTLRPYRDKRNAVNTTYTENAACFYADGIINISLLSEETEVITSS